MIARALELGAARVRITDASPDTIARERMQASFERDDLQTWKYDDRYAQAATDPKTILGDARRVVCIAVPYAVAATRTSAPSQGRVSNYAWSTDYHHELAAVLRELVAMLDAAAGRSVARAVCDTAPLAERALAARSGLAWIGKHTNAIVPEVGSYVFLGEVVTSLELPIDAPLRTSCGSCARCIEACPTRALRGDYTIDARRCISDLTQRKDAIPREWRGAIGQWVWGCDLCQTVCPPTRNAGAQGSARFAPLDAHSAVPDLARLLHLTNVEFKARFAKTAMGWRGAAVLRRNAAVALGNSLDRACVPALALALETDSHAGVREHVAWALGKIGSPQAIAALRTALPREREAAILREIQLSLEERSGTLASPTSL